MTDAPSRCSFTLLTKRLLRATPTFVTHWHLLKACAELPLHNTMLHYTVLHCAALYCAALHYTALQCIALHCTVPYCTVSPVPPFHISQNARPLSGPVRPPKSCRVSLLPLTQKVIFQSYVVTLCMNRKASSGGVPNGSYPPVFAYVRVMSTCPTPSRDCRAIAMSLSNASNAVGGVLCPSRVKWKYLDSTIDPVVRTSTDGS